MNNLEDKEQLQQETRTLKIEKETYEIIVDDTEENKKILYECILEHIVPKVAKYFKKIYYRKIQREVIFWIPRILKFYARRYMTYPHVVVKFGEKFKELDFLIAEKYQTLTGIDKIKFPKKLEPKQNKLDKLTFEELKEIKARIWRNENRKKISSELGISIEHLSQIEFGERFKDIPVPNCEKKVLGDIKGDRPAKKRKHKTMPEKVIIYQKLTSKDVAIIKRRLIDGERPTDLAKEFGIGFKMLNHIKLGRRWWYVEPAPPNDLNDKSN